MNARTCVSVRHAAAPVEARPTACETEIRVIVSRMSNSHGMYWYVCMYVCMYVCTMYVGM